MSLGSSSSGGSAASVSSASSSRRGGSPDDWPDLNNSMESINLRGGGDGDDDDVELIEEFEDEVETGREAAADDDDDIDEEACDSEQNSSNRSAEDGHGHGRDNVHDEMRKLLPRSSFVYKYHIAPGNAADSDLSLLWLIGNMINSHSTSALFGKYRKLRVAAKNAQLVHTAETLNAHVAELLQIVPAAALADQHGVGASGFNRFYKIGVFIQGLLAMANLQLRIYKNDLQNSYTNIWRGDVQSCTINLATDTKRPTKKINVSNMSHLLVEDPQVHLSFNNMEFEIGIGEHESPRKAAGDAFLSEPEVLEPDSSDLVRSHDLHEKTKKQQRKRKRQQEKNILEQLQDISLHDENLISDINLPGNVPMADTFGTYLPLPDEINAPEIIDEQENNRGGPEQEVSPKRPSLTQPPAPAPPRKRRALQNALELEPLDEDNRPIAKKSPGGKRRRQLKFGDTEIEMPKRAMLARTKAAMPDQEKLALLMDGLAPTMVPLEGMSLIESFGRKHPSSRLNEMFSTLVNQSNIRKEVDGQTHTIPAIIVSPPDLEPAEALREQGTVLSDLHTNSTVNRGDGKEPIQTTPEQMEPNAGAAADRDQILNNMFEEPFGTVLPLPDDTGMEWHQPKGPNKTFEQIVGLPSHTTKLEVARTFALLLRLQAERKVQLFQHEPYGEIGVQKL